MDEKMDDQGRRPGAVAPSHARRGGAAALRTCPSCGLTVAATAEECRSCGAALAYRADIDIARRRTALGRQAALGDIGMRSRTAYIVLALLLGGIGVHNFYAGRGAQGGKQLALNVVNQVLWTWGFFSAEPTLFVLSAVGGLALFVWIIVDIVTVTEDGDGYLLG